MVNYPTILGLPQEDIDRQLYVGVLGLESRVKALENKSKPILEITVTDGTNPVSGATVTIGTDEETSDSDGVVEFELAYGDYSATIEASGYATATESLAFRSNHKNFTVTLESATGTGTVTVTTVDSEQTPLTDSFVFLCDTNEFPTEQDDSNVVAIGYGDKNGECSLALYDTSTHQQTEVTDIPFDDYYLFGLSPTDGLTYSGTLTVDGDETVTITLIEAGD